jgi:hypothetical protein
MRDSIAPSPAQRLAVWQNTRPLLPQQQRQQLQTPELKPATVEASQRALP